MEGEGPEEEKLGPGGDREVISTLTDRRLIKGMQAGRQQNSTRRASGDEDDWAREPRKSSRNTETLPDLRQHNTVRIGLFFILFKDVTDR